MNAELCGLLAHEVTPVGAALMADWFADHSADQFADDWAKIARIQSVVEAILAGGIVERLWVGCRIQLVPIDDDVMEEWAIFQQGQCKYVGFPLGFTDARVIALRLYSCMVRWDETWIVDHSMYYQLEENQ